MAKAKKTGSFGGLGLNKKNVLGSKIGGLSGEAGRVGKGFSGA